VEAVEAHELTGPIDLDVALGLGCSADLRWSGIAGHERQACHAPREAMPAQDAPDPGVADADAAPAILGQAGADPAGPETRVRDREGEDAFLDDRVRLVGHARRSSLPRAQHRQAAAFDHVLPAVVGRAVHAEDAAGLADVAQLAGVIEQAQAEPVQDVRIEHGAGSPAHGFRHREHGVPAPLPTWVELSRLLGGCSL
jgi:hypothetical protein